MPGVNHDSDTNLPTPLIAGQPPRCRLHGRRGESDMLDRLVADVRAGQSRVLVLRGEPGTGKTALLNYLARRAAGCRVVRVSGRQLPASPLGESFHSHLVQHAVGGAQLLPGLRAAALAAQPFAVEQVGAGKLRAKLGAAQPVDRLPVQAVGGLALAHQRAGARLEAQPPIVAAGLGRSRQPRHGVAGHG
ncbi:MAG: ATP-binding protein, partial [Streptosporangiaceae bacterium]